MIEQSEFGQGFTYCIGLFLMHAERKDIEGVMMGLWFNGAADHLYQLEIPENFVLKDECKEWQHKCLKWRLEEYTKEDRDWAIEQAKKFLLAWDKQNKIPCEKGQWE